MIYFGKLILFCNFASVSNSQKGLFRSEQPNGER